MKKLIIPIILSLIVVSCNNQSNAPIIGKRSLTLNNNIMTPEILWSFGRLSDIQLSPDKTTVLYGVTYFDIKENKSNRDIFSIPVQGGEPKQLTRTPEKEYNAVWSPDGKKIAYLSSKNGESQIWEMNPDGSGKKQISNVGGDITNFAYAPTQDRIFFTMDVKIDNDVSDTYPDLPKAEAKLVTDLMYRHWDTWEDGKYSHIFIAGYDNGELSEPTDIMKGEPYDTPLQPFGGIEEITWSPDGKKIAYTCKKLKGKEYSLSTNSEIYLYDIGTKSTTNLTEGMPGYDRVPVFSPDGKKMAWLSMERPGYEADKERLFTYNFDTKEKVYHTVNFDYSPSNMNWEDNENIYFIAGVEATFQLFKINLISNEITAITKGDHDYRSLALAGNNTLITTRVQISKPEEIYRVNIKTGNAEEISFENKHLLDQLSMGQVEKRWIKTTDGKNMLTWVVYPPQFDKSKTYPAILYCEGGPQSALSQYWSYRWNFQMMAAYGYIVIAPNRRGVLTFGQSWTDQVSKDNGGQEMLDYLSAVDSLKKEPYIDENRLGAVGPSYGGFSVFWLAGHHQKRFKAFIAHCGVFNAEMEYATTDEMFFDNWENGGAYWEKNNPVAMKSYEKSPHRFVQNWDTPILVIHGQNDFRIPYTQGMAAFNSAQLLNIPSQLLLFPEENHWVLSPQNGILWQRTFSSWLDSWLK